MISAQCVACDLHTIVLGPFECMVRVGDGSRHGEEIVKKSRIAPFNAIIIIIIIIIFVFSQCAVLHENVLCCLRY